MKKILSIIIIGLLIICSFGVQGFSNLKQNIYYNLYDKDDSNCSNKNSINQRTIYVDDDGGADYIKIQDAINAASNDDTIFVYNGIYNENINIDKRIILEGENKEFTVINGGEIDSVIKVNSDNVVISGFTITNCSNSSDYAGIMINSDHIEVNDCNISYNKGYGIICRQITDVLIKNNLVSNNYYNGINLESVENSEISDNIIKDHIYWYYSFGGTVPLSHGLYLDNANTITVSNNDFSDALNVDLVLLSSTNIKVENNRFTSRAGVVIWGGYNHWNSHTFNDNTVDDKPIYYYKNNLIGKTVPEDAGEVILANCRNFKIHNLSIHDGDVGISIGYCLNTEIMNNVIENVAEGIYIDNSDYSYVAGNNVYNVWGIPFLYSCNNTFINNVIDSNFRYGLGLWYGSDYNLVYNNLIFNCSEDGIISYESNFNQIVFNTVSGNNQSGFEIVDSDNNEISGNIISDNNDDGVKLNFGSTGNIFHHNNFVNNSLKNVRSGYGNFWDFDLYGGNFWSDYSGVDVDGDGFGDEPYVIVGNNMDNYPYINPIIFNNPFKPDAPVGPLSGRLRDDIVFTFCGFDSFDYDLFYMVDWGDNSDDIWHGPYCSGESVNISHSWSSQGDFNIRVKTKNIIGIESEWSDPLVVSMPKSNNLLLDFFLQFLENHPIIYKILQLIT